MVPTYPSVQSFYQREISLPKVDHHSVPLATVPGDAFNAEEIEIALDPLRTKFNPSCEYVETDIGSLVPGPQRVTFMGRVVNYNVHYGQSKSHAAATGWHHIILKDDTGVITV